MRKSLCQNGLISRVCSQLSNQVPITPLTSCSREVAFTHSMILWIKGPKIDQLLLFPKLKARPLLFSRMLLSWEIQAQIQSIIRIFLPCSLKILRGALARIKVTRFILARWMSLQKVTNSQLGSQVIGSLQIWSIKQIKKKIKWLWIYNNNSSN